MTNKADFGVRLCAALQAQGVPLRPSVLEREFNKRYWGRSVSLQAVRRWMRGEAIPSQDKLQVLAEWLRIEPQILRFGEEAVRAVRSSRQRWEEVAYAERATLDAFLRLPIEQRRVVQQVIEAFGLAYGDKNPSER
jgi:transcriptional regulator with XRE-family HTH domain